MIEIHRNFMYSDIAFRQGSLNSEFSMNLDKSILAPYINRGNWYDLKSIFWHMASDKSLSKSEFSMNLDRQKGKSKIRKYLLTTDSLWLLSF